MVSYSSTHFPILISRGVMEPRDRDTEGDKENLRSRGRGSGGYVDRGPLGSLGRGGGSLLSSFAAASSLGVGGGTWSGGCGPASPPLSSPRAEGRG